MFFVIKHNFFNVCGHDTVIYGHDLSCTSLLCMCIHMNSVCVHTHMQIAYITCIDSNEFIIKVTKQKNQYKTNLHVINLLRPNSWNENKKETDMHTYHTRTGSRIYESIRSDRKLASHSHIHGCPTKRSKAKWENVHCACMVVCVFRSEWSFIPYVLFTLKAFK